MLLEGCDPTGSLLPFGAERFVPPKVYEEWWQLTEQCSGLTGDFAAVSWYHVPGAVDIPPGDGSLVNGRWDEAENRIILGGESERAGDLVRHEMLHALLRASGHPRQQFIARCGGTVVCTQQCIRDAGPAPEPNPLAGNVSPSALEIGVEVSPSAPGSSINEGNFMMVVTARNPSSSPVIVQLPPAGDAGPPVSFSYDIKGSGRGNSYAMRAEVPEVTWFAPLEEKRFIFDFHIGPGDLRYDQQPGTYQFRGAYGGVWASNAPTVVVSP
jgi:hypothetical protein